MITNADITIYNKYIDNNTRTVKYKKTYLYGVNWQEKQTINIGDKSTNKAYSIDIVTVYIPFTVSSLKAYIEPTKYYKLSEEEKNNYFTINNEDIIARGIIDKDIMKISDLDNGVLIDSVITNDNGSYFMKHWQVGGVY